MTHLIGPETGRALAITATIAATVSITAGQTIYKGNISFINLINSPVGVPDEIVDHAVGKAKEHK